MTYTEKLQKIINHFGAEHQVKVKLVEELKELIEAIENDDEDGIVEGLADVGLMIDQAMMIKNFDVEVYWNNQEFKVNRTLERIESGYYENTYKPEKTD